MRARAGGVLIGLAGLALAIGAWPASGDVSPQVVMATPGDGGGAIDRYTLRFSEPMVPLGDPRATAPVKVVCPVSGTGRWIDQQTFVHEFSAPVPGGVTCSFDLNDGLKSLRGAEIGGQRRFTLDTGGPSARAVLPAYGELEEDQTFIVAANIAPNRQSVAANAYCAVDGIGEKIPVDLLPADVPGRVIDGLGADSYRVRSFLRDAGLPEAQHEDARARAGILKNAVALKCRRPLPPGRDMALVWGGGITGAGGRTAGEDHRFDYRVRVAFEARFECSRVNPRAGCSPVEPANLRFTAPIPTEQARKIRLEIGGKSIAPVEPKEKSATVSEVTFAAPLPESAEGQVVLPADVKDESGRPLANARRFPLTVRIDAPPPLVKFAADFGIIEAKEDGMLPVTVRNVEPSLGGDRLSISGAVARIGEDDRAVAQWLRRIEKAAGSDYRSERRGDDTVTVNHTGATSILKGAAGASPLTVPLPGKGKAFEVVGIPLKKPGFYVVEFASPTLGRALLGRDVPRYVAAGALVTNMAVHFKWGRANSLAWVTQLDSGKPVSGADIRVTDACSGRLIAEGASDGQGRLLLRGALPEPRTYGSCENGDDHPLMISARKSGDFSFTLTQWSEGIRPYDFDVTFGYSKPEDIFHTIFDRTLMKAGETVHMKHVVRRPVARGFAFAGAMSGTLHVAHRGSDTMFDMPFSIGADGVGETVWTAPPGAPQGEYDLRFDMGERIIFSAQTIRVDEYRLPTMRATISGPKQAAVRPKSLPLSLYVGYLSGGGAGGMGVSVRTAFEEDASAPRGWDGYSFGGRAIKEGVTPLDGDGQEIAAPLPSAQTIPVTLDGQGAARTTIGLPQTLDVPTTLAVEMDYQDANGEVLTAASRILLHPAAVRVGVKTDGWLMRDDDLRLKFVVLDTEGKPVKGRKVSVTLYSREVISARRRLIGGFYAFDNNARVIRISVTCGVKTDAQGQADCAIDPGVSGEVYVVATVEDDDGNVSRAVRSVWLAGDDEWWFGGDNGDRMDLVPEQREYKAGDTARFQVRMPFRSATALVTVEREGVLSSFVTTLSGKDPVVEVKLDGSYAPDVYVSVLAVRGRIAGWRLWLADFARRWNLPFFVREGAKPTALVDLAKPGFRLGVAKIDVGWDASRLAVEVTPNAKTYHVRDVAQVGVQVRDAAGRAPKSAEIAFAAVDEALLQLAPNPSWRLLDTMMGERPLSVLTSTAQMQVVGKRHYGRKAVAAGGGGGDLSAVNREDFRPVLLWRGRVPLDAQGRARVAVPLSDSLSAFRLVAVATAGPGLFGTGEASVRTTQDLTVYSGVPPLVRTGDRFGATFTLRNGSDRPMQVTATAVTTPRVGTAPPLTVTIPAGGAAPVTWHMPAPAGIDRLEWTVDARAADGRAADKVTVSQTVVPLVPVETWAATLARVGPATRIMLAPPAGALPGRGEVQVTLSSTLAPPLEGVRRYMLAYPFTCFEQQLSRAIVAGDSATWARLSGEMPAFLDRDGLLRYFPTGMDGSEALTAYVLSITAETGWAIPQASRERMIAALTAVAEGRLSRDGAGQGDRRFHRVAALAALARAGATTPAMIGQIGIAPRDMPTGVLADWIVAVTRTAGADPALRVAAEEVLRTRIVYEGSRFDLTDKANAPWWMMTSADEMAIRALLATLGRPGWQEDAPRMMVGVSLRQRRGHWDTTPANAWGTVLARRFAALYPAEAIAGTTTVSLGGATRTAAWPLTDAPLLRLPLPAAESPLVMAQAGGAGPWAQVALTAAVPLRQPLFAGYRLQRSVSVIQQRNKGRLTRGDVLKVTLTVDASAERNWVVVSDPIPAGATIVGGLGGQSQQIAAQAAGGEGVSPSYVERGQDAWRGYFAWVPRGRFTVEYAVRLNGVGHFQLPPSRVEAMYSPDIRAAVPNAAVTVAAR